MRTLIARHAPYATLALTFILAGCGTGGPAYGPSTPGVDAVVEMTSNLTFEPATVRVPVGGTVEWRNKSTFTHTATADPGKDRKTSLPAGALPFDSGNVAPGEVYRHVFTVAGRYDYSCLPHSWMGMTGTVIVAPR